MMRDILFRAKALHNNEWVYGDYLSTIRRNGEKKHYIKRAEDGLLTPIEIIPETLEQSTGLFDCNGKIIFEGDIVKVETSSNEEKTTEITKVGYDLSLCSFYPMNWNYSCDGCDCYFRVEKIEIIGNTTDSPELLGGAE